MDHQNQPLINQSASALEWPLLMDHLADVAVFDETKEHFQRELLGHKDLDPEEIFDRTEEMLSVLASDGGWFRFRNISIRDSLDDLRLGRMLSPQGLLSIRHLLEMSLSAQSFVTSKDHGLRKKQFPKLAVLAGELRPNAQLAERLVISIGDDAQVLDTASPELARSRAAVASAERRLITELERMLSSSSIRDALQDAVWMLRDGRYVLPVRTDRKSTVEGVTVAVSQSGSTLFIEPASLALTKSSLDAARRDEQIEEARVLSELSKACRAQEEPLFNDARVLRELDAIVARAELARRLGGVRPTLSHSRNLPLFSFEDIRHPLFILESKPCVSHTLHLRHENHRVETESKSGGPHASNFPCVLVLSGPNAGGKTVSMKTFGLAVLMARAGLFVPARKAQIYAFQHVFASIGDSQDRKEDLSTFSAHLRSLRDIMESSGPNTMVLLDEGFVGTDPAMGAALARAVLEDFASRGVCTIITTHFSELKTVSDENSAFLNASMEFEQRQLKPTYSLLAGIPGQSYALELAARMGFDDALLIRAKELHGKEAGRLEKLLRDLQKARTEVDDERKRQQELRQNLEVLKGDLEAEKKLLISLRTGLGEHYESQLRKRFNSYRNTLEIRERQFQKRKEQILADIALEREEMERAKSQSTEKSGVKNESGIGNNGSIPSTTTPHEQSMGRQAFSKDRSIDPSKSRTLPLRDFASLGKVRIEKGKTPSSPIKDSKSSPTHRKWIQGSRWNTEEDDELIEDLSFDADRSLREIEDEALLEMDILKSEMNSLENELDQDIVKRLGPLEERQNALQKKNLNPVLSQIGPEPHEFRRGTKVKSKGFKGEGQVLEEANSKGLVSCRFGGMNVKIPYRDLEILAKASPVITEKAAVSPGRLISPKKGRTGQRKSPGSAVLDGEIPPIAVFPSRSINLRGMTVDIALEKADLFLDRMIREEVDSCVIVHGHGTGSLKKALRQWISELPISCRYRPGTQGEGGDGATIIVFD